MRTASVLTLVALAALLAPPASAGSLAGVTLPETVQVGGQSLTLNGMGLRTKLMFKVYVAGLYLDAREGAAEAILAKDAPRRMEMRFLREVGGEKICEGWQEGLTANTPGASPELKQQFDQLCAFMEEVPDGGIITLTYQPDQGTEIVAQGRVKGRIEGKAFADAVLACWIGPKPGPGEEFKQGILGH